jgi:hypothetical protein
MANILSLALRVTADASGLRLDPVQRALVNLGNEADKLTSQFDKFASGSAAAAAAQAQFAKQSQDLINTLRDNGSATQFAADFERLAAAAREQAAAFAEGEAIQKRYGDAAQNTQQQLDRLTELYKLGAIDLIAYNNASIALLGIDEQAAASAKERADAQAEAARQSAALEAEAARIRQSNLTAQERFDIAIGRASELRRQGLLTEQDFNRELEKQSRIFAKNTIAADGLANSIENAGDQSLKFNELSGILAVLPGPLGNIAGRISGIASASEGLSRIFAGGLSQGIASVGASLGALLANPLVLAAAAIAAVVAATGAAVRGLAELDERVETLGNAADKLGVSFEFIQVLEESARRSGTSIEAVEGAFVRLQASLTGVDEESKRAQQALSDIGVSAEELRSLDPQEQFTLLAQGINDIEDPARRSAAAIALFGRSGATLLPLFNNLPGARADLEQFGAVLSDVDRSRIDGVGAAFDRASVVLRALGQAVLVPLAGYVEGLINAFTGLANVVTAVVQVLQPAFDRIGQLWSGIGSVLNNVAGFIRSFRSDSEDSAQSVNRVTETVAVSVEEVEKLNKAFADSQKGLDAAIAKAGEFGQAGFDAAFEFEQALADLQEQAGEGELNAEQYARGVANATAEFEKQIDVARRVAEENRRLAEEAQRRAEAEAKAVQDIIDANLEQIRVDEQFGGDSSRARAAENLLKIQQEIVRVEEQLQAARAAGDTEAINALTSRLATLDQVEARENDIASGAKKAREDAAKEAERLAQELNQIAADRQREIDRVNQQIADAQAKFADRQFEIELARAEELATVRTGSIEINDIRSGGISAFFDTLREDPAITEAKKQTAELEKMRKEIAKLNAEKVDILAGTG